LHLFKMFVLYLFSNLSTSVHLLLAAVSLCRRCVTAVDDVTQTQVSNAAADCEMYARRRPYVFSLALIIRRELRVFISGHIAHAPSVTV